MQSEILGYGTLKRAITQRGQSISEFIITHSRHIIQTQSPTSIRPPSSKFETRLRNIIKPAIFVRYNALVFRGDRSIRFRWEPPIQNHTWCETERQKGHRQQRTKCFADFGGDIKRSDRGWADPFVTWKPENADAYSCVFLSINTIDWLDGECDAFA